MHSTTLTICFICTMMIITACHSNKYMMRKKEMAKENAGLEFECDKIFKNGFSGVRTIARISLNSDTIHEVRYQCVFSSFYTQKLMYDRFGKWDSAVEIGKFSRLLKWKNVDLFDDGRVFSVYADGVENDFESFASILVFDEKMNDVLNYQHEDRQSVIELIGVWIRQNEDKNEEFYEKYYTTFFPERWKEIQQSKEFYQKLKNDVE